MHSFSRFLALLLILALPVGAGATVQTTYNSLSGSLAISLSEGSSVSVTSVDGILKVNGMDPGEQPANASTLNNIQLVTFDNEDYLIDLSGVSPANGFTRPTLSYLLSVGGGESEVLLPVTSGQLVSGGCQCSVTVPLGGEVRVNWLPTSGELDFSGDGLVRLEVNASGPARGYSVRGTGGAVDAQIADSSAQVLSTATTRFLVTSTANQMDFTVEDLGSAPLDRVELRLDEGNALFDASGEPSFETLILMGPAAAEVTALGPQGPNTTIHFLDRNNNDTRIFTSDRGSDGTFFVHTDFFPIGQRLTFRDFRKLEVFGFGGNDRFHFERYPLGTGLEELILHGGQGLNRFRVRPNNEFSIDVIGGGAELTDELAVDTRGADASFSEEDGTGFVTVIGTKGVSFSGIAEIELFDGTPVFEPVDAWLISSP